MANIEFVIKIDEKYIKQIDKIKFLIGGKKDRNLQINVINAIKNGIPLPKGHGRLIDYSWVVDNVIKKLGIKDERYLLEAEKALMSIVEIAPTIIEADKAESEDEE